MLLDVHGQGLSLDGAVRKHVERRLMFALGRFGDRIGWVTVHLIDTNGPRGGVDKLCRVVVEVRGCGRTVVENADSDLNAVIDRAADRVGEAVHRNLDRARRHSGLRERRAPSGGIDRPQRILARGDRT